MKYAMIQNENLDTLYTTVSEKRQKWAQATSTSAKEKAEKACKEAKSDFENAVFKAVMAKCFEQENPVTAFISDPVMPLLKVSEKSLDRTQVIRERMIFNFFKGFEGMEGVPVEKRDKYCPASDWLDKVEAARKACVGYVSMQEISDEKQADHCVSFENVFDSKKTLKPLEKENGKFSKKACKRALNDMLKALFVTPEGETAFRCLKDNQVESVLSKLNKSKNGESVYAKNAQEFFAACVPMLIAYVNGTEIKQRLSKLTDADKDALKWDAPAAPAAK